MYVIKLKTFMRAVFSLLTLILFVDIITKSIFYSKKTETMSRCFNKKIVIDAGHGLPDGGASANGIVESEINLIIAQKLNDALNNRGYETIMTRENEYGLDKQKGADLSKRVEIINNSGSDFCISIHMNKFENKKYWGWQTFYNVHSEDGKALAQDIQNGIKESVSKENKRTALKIEGIKIIDKTNIPVVIVECGFISNDEEALLLQEDEYQNMLVEGICDGVEKFYKAF